MIPDCSVLRTPAIFKTFVLRSFFFENGYLLMFWRVQNLKILVQALLASDFQTLDTGIIK